MNKILLTWLCGVLLVVSGCVHAPNNQESTTDDTTDTETQEQTDTTATNDGGTVQSGDTIAVHYVGKLEDGSVFDTSRESVAQEADIYNEQRPYEPLEFTVGAGQMIPGFDQGVRGMEVGDTKTLTIPPEDAYGQVREDLVQTFPKSEFSGSGIEPQVGETYNFGMAAGTVQSISGDQITIDFNHFLAGKTLTFEVELVAIR